jgi:hypothetical protein
MTIHSAAANTTVLQKIIRMFETGSLTGPSPAGFSTAAQAP